ncbi:hypothetical protein MMC22_005183 [Lobaria immixta]|nr:hypothetical protein [Lobaria immixta]
MLGVGMLHRALKLILLQSKITRKRVYYQPDISIDTLAERLAAACHHLHRAETIDYALFGWTLENYLPCDSDSDCPKFPVTSNYMQLKNGGSQQQAAEMGESSSYAGQADQPATGESSSTQGLRKQKRPSPPGSQKFTHFRPAPGPGPKPQDLASQFCHNLNPSYPPEDILQAFQRTSNPELLKDLFFAIGSPRAVSQLQDMRQGMCQQQRVLTISYHQTNRAVIQTLNSLDRFMAT